MKICLLTHTLPRFAEDTAAPFIADLASEWSKQGHRVVVVAPYDPKIDLQIKRNFKLIIFKYAPFSKLHILGYSKTLRDDQSMSVMSYLISPFFYLFAFLKLLRLIKKEKFDVISAHWLLPNGLIASVVSILTKTPFTVTIPGSDVYMAGKNFIFKKLVGFAISRSPRIISDNAYYLTQLKSMGFSLPSSDIIRYGVNPEDFKITPRNKALSEKLGILPDSKVLLLAGRLVTKKGFKYAINSFPKIFTLFPKTKAIIIGDGEQKRNLERLVNKLGIKDKVIFVGMIPYNDLNNYYSLANIFIMPSIKDDKGNLDASPVTMMLAMICGCSIVATKYALDNSLINSNYSLLVKERSSESISSAVISLLKKDLFKNVQNEVRDLAINSFSVEKSANKYISIFERLE